MPYYINSSANNPLVSNDMHTNPGYKGSYPLVLANLAKMPFKIEFSPNGDPIYCPNKMLNALRALENNLTQQEEAKKAGNEPTQEMKDRETTILKAIKESESEYLSIQKLSQEQAAKKEAKKAQLQAQAIEAAKQAEAKKAEAEAKKAATQDWLQAEIARADQERKDFIAALKAPAKNPQEESIKKVDEQAAQEEAKRIADAKAAQEAAEKLLQEQAAKKEAIKAQLEAKAKQAAIEAAQKEEAKKALEAKEKAEKEAEAKRIADAKAAEEKRLADEKAKAALEAKEKAEKEAEAKRIADAKALLALQQQKLNPVLATVQTNNPSVAPTVNNSKSSTNSFWYYTTLGIGATVIGCFAGPVILPVIVGLELVSMMTGALTSIVISFVVNKGANTLKNVIWNDNTTIGSDNPSFLSKAFALGSTAVVAYAAPEEVASTVMEEVFGKLFSKAADSCGISI